MKLASFDIFDTTLIRKCGKPENIFYLLAHKLYPTDSAKREDFLLWRRDAERYAARRHPGKEITIEDIYSGEELESFNEYSREELIAAEKSVEVENLIANPAIRDIIKEKREQGYTIGFISDMYLDSDTLKSALAKEDCIAEGEKVYVSCEWDARKSSGALYKKLKSTINPTQWEHYGDHPVSDVKKARENGIKATKIDTSFSVTETETLKDKRNNYNVSCLVGLQRAARIYHRNNEYANLTADFVVPAYIPYVYFVINKAKELGIKRLFFLSRDSYILQRIAENIQHNDIELSYLFISRKALLLPYLQNATKEKFLTIQDKKTLVGKTVNEIAELLGTNLAELNNSFNICFNFNKITTKEEEEEFLEAIFGTNSNYLPVLKHRAEEKRLLLNNYLLQEKVLSGNDKVAMVDVGWLGTTRLMINSIAKEEKKNEVCFFYYGVRADVLHSRYGRYYTYNLPENSNTELTFVVEDYFSASPYKTTIGYYTDNGIVKVQLADENEYNNIIDTNRNIVQWITKEFEKLPIEIKNNITFWGPLALKNAVDNIHNYKLTPLVESHISHKLNIKDFVNIILLGAHKSLYDKGSVSLSCPRKLFPLLWYIHQKTKKMRHYLAKIIK